MLRLRSFLLVDAATLGLAQAAAAGPGHPLRASVAIRVTVGSFYGDSGVVHRGGALWFAAVTNTTVEGGVVRIYRWSGSRWRLVGRVATPTPVGTCCGGTPEPAELTGQSAPGFAVRSTGADTQWLTVIARVGGRWEAMPFDWVDGPSRAVTGGVRGRLVLGSGNGCGCAGGYSTWTWYRFDRWRFVPTRPPGANPACSASALDRARPHRFWRANQVLSSADSRHLAPAFHVSWFACVDGWALARGLSGKRAAIGLFEANGGAWTKVYVASGSAGRLPRKGFTVPGSVLHRLERILGLPRTHLARRSEEGGLWGPDLRYLSKRQRATVSLHLTPGSSYVDLDAGCRGSRWLVTATRSTYHHPRTTTTVHVYRWNRVTWVPRRNRIVSGRPASSLWRRIEFFPFDGERGCRLISAATHR